MTISVVSWHQMDTRLTQFVLDTRLVLETWLIFQTRPCLAFWGDGISRADVSAPTLRPMRSPIRGAMSWGK